MDCNVAIGNDERFWFTKFFRNEGTSFREQTMLNNDIVGVFFKINSQFIVFAHNYTDFFE